MCQWGRGKIHKMCQSRGENIDKRRSCHIIGPLEGIAGRPILSQ
jgi:hypothetical protein